MLHAALARHHNVFTFKLKPNQTRSFLKTDTFQNTCIWVGCETNIIEMHVWFVKWSIHLRCNHNFQQYTGFLKIKAWLLKNLMKSACYYNWNWNVQYCASVWVLISCIFNTFLQLLWEKVQGVPETVRPPEGVPGHHEPEVTLRWETACWNWLSLT